MSIINKLLLDEFIIQGVRKNVNGLAEFFTICLQARLKTTFSFIIRSKIFRIFTVDIP